MSKRPIPADREYTVLQEFWLSGRRYLVGSTVTLSPRVAANLVRAGHLAAPEAPAPKKAFAPKPAKKED